MKEVVIKIEGEDWKKALDKAFKKLNKEAKIDGFRPGKAPKEVYIKKYGMTSLYMEAAESCLNEAYEMMLKENGDDVIVAQPEINLSAVTDDYVEFKFNLTLKPEVKLGKYKGLDVKKDTVKVTKKEVSEAIEQMRQRYMENIDKEGKVANGDVAIIDFEGFKDGVAFEGGKGENHPLEIGSGSFIPGFEEQLIGMGVGEEKEIEVTFPENYQAADLAGQKATFKVKVHEIKSKVLPEIDDELAKDVNVDGIETLADLETYTKEQIKNRKQNEAEAKFSDDIFNAVIENTPLEVPDAMIETELQQMLREVEQNLSQQGLTMDLFQQLTGKTLDDMKAEMREQAEKRVKFNLILSEIVKAENIEVSDDEVDDEIKEIATYYGREFDEVKKLFEGQLGQIRNDLATRKAVQLIKDNVK